MMKKIISHLIIFPILLNSVFCSNAFAYGEEYMNYTYEIKQKYSDVPTDYWAFDAINQVTAKKWFGGYPDGSFKPNSSITRAEAAKVFAEFLGLEISNVQESSFYDVDLDKWYAPYVEAASDLFPVHTTIQGKRPFLPESPVTREDVVYALVQSLGCINNKKYVDMSVLDMFEDAGSISSDVKPYFSVALTEGLVSGYPDDTIRAQSQLTRAEFATLLLRGTKHGFHDNYEAKIESVTVYPSSKIDIEAGETVILTARALYTGGKNLDYDSLMPYDSLNSGIVSINNNTIIGLKEGTTIIKFNSEYLINDVLTINVEKKNFGPKLKIFDFPEETENSTATIRGYIEEDSVENIKLSCNNQPIEIKDDKSFLYVADIVSWQNEFIFVAEDEFGGESEKKITIIKPSTPEIVVESFNKNTTSKQEVIYGHIKNCDINDVKLTCNGENVSIDEDGSFEAEVTLWLMGENKITLKAINKHNKKDEQEIIITRYEFYKER